MRTTDHSGFLPAPIRMTLNDLECPIHLKVRFTEGTLVPSVVAFEFESHNGTLWLSNSTIHIGLVVARGGGGVWAGGSIASMWAADALFLCGS